MSAPPCVSSCREGKSVTKYHVGPHNFRRRGQTSRSASRSSSASLAPALPVRVKTEAAGRACSAGDW